MKRYALLLLQNGGNQVCDEVGPCEKSTAIANFKERFPHLNLDNDGYAKIGLANGGHITYCIAECWNYCRN